jgi:hypothetical protein
MSLYLWSILPVRMLKITHRMAIRELFLGGLFLALMGFGEIRGLGADEPGAQNASASSSAPVSNPQSTNDFNPSAMGSLLDLFVKKGFVTQDEANQVKAEAEAERTNSQDFSNVSLSNWKTSDGTGRMELFGDIRARYEDRKAEAPNGDNNIDMDRERYSVRLGLRGALFDNFYYGVRLETGTSPRSSWVTAGSSSSGTTYTGPYGKSTAGVNIGQVYMGWRQGNWMDITLGKMPNPLYTSTLVWSSSINPEGAAEKFKYTVGEADFFATFCQFVYQDFSGNNFASGGLLGNGALGQMVPNIYQIAWQGGLTYHVTDKLTAKAGATMYQYFGLKPGTITADTTTSYFSDAYVGEGAYAGPGSSYPIYGWSGYGLPSIVLGDGSSGYPNNQVGLNNLLVLEVPFEVNYKFDKMVLRGFGDVAYNFEGSQRADAAAAGYSAYLSSLPPPGAKISGFSPQTSQVKAYQIGFGIGSTNVVYGQTQGLVYGTGSAKNAWELRAYWQHIEQYSLDPNLLDADFFNGLENMQGVYAAFAYGFSANVSGTIRYGFASRIDNQLGTGGTSQDIQQINPVQHYNILQLDMTVRF